MPFLPKQLTSLVTGDSTLARVGSNVRSAVQPTLDFLQQNFSQGADGTLRFVRNTIANGTLRVLGTTLFSNDVAIIGGNFFMKCRTGNGFVIIPADVNGDPPFYVTNPANTDAQFLVNANGQCNAVRYYSRNGFKRTIRMGVYWSSTKGMPPNYTIMLDPIVTADGTQYQNMNAVYYAPFAGSVVGITCYANGSIGSGNTFSVCLFKNGAQTALSATGSAGPLITTANKNQYAFNQGDALAIYIRGSNSATNQAFSAHIEVESDG